MIFFTLASFFIFIALAYGLLMILSFHDLEGFIKLGRLNPYDHELLAFEYQIDQVLYFYDFSQFSRITSLHFIVSSIDSSVKSMHSFITHQTCFGTSVYREDPKYWSKT